VLTCMYLHLNRNKINRACFLMVIHTCDKPEFFEQNAQGLIDGCPRFYPPLTVLQVVSDIWKEGSWCTQQDAYRQAGILYGVA
jgi:hypothetical protein